MHGGAWLAAQPLVASTFLDIIEEGTPSSPVDLWLLIVIRGISQAMRTRWFVVAGLWWHVAVTGRTRARAARASSIA